MSAQQPNLSSAQFGYDIVVATSQASINSTLAAMFYEGNAENKFPVITMYYGVDANRNTYLMDYNTVMAQTNNTNPFTVQSWDGTGTMPDAISNISKSQFRYGFQAQIGLPVCYQNNPDSLPEIITLNTGDETVIYHLLSASFKIVQCNFNDDKIVNYLSASQPDDSAWVFTSVVPLAKINNQDDLPQPVKDQINDMNDAFSVQKLFLDVDNATLETKPDISGVDSNSDVYKALTKAF